MVNAFMIQLYIPLNFLGVIYREIKQSLTLDKMFVLMDKEREGGRCPSARSRCTGLTSPPCGLRTCTLPTTLGAPFCKA